MQSRRNTFDVQSQMLQEADSFDEKVRIISETVRKINNQCFAAIEDLASKRGNKDGYPDSDGEQSALTSPVPDLDSRATTAQSGSIADLQDSTDVGGPVRIHAIAEEMESEEGGEHFVDAEPVVEKDDRMDIGKGIGISMPGSV